MLLYVHNSLRAEEVKMESSFEESLFVKIDTNKYEQLLVGLLYRSPSDKSEASHERMRLLISEAANMRFTHHLFMGDFNYPQIIGIHLQLVVETPKSRNSSIA